MVCVVFSVFEVVAGATGLSMLQVFMLLLGRLTRVDVSWMQDTSMQGRCHFCVGVFAFVSFILCLAFVSLCAHDCIHFFSGSYLGCNWSFWSPFCGRLIGMVGDWEGLRCHCCFTGMLIFYGLYHLSAASCGWDVNFFGEMFVKAGSSYVFFLCPAFHIMLYYCKLSF